MITKYNKFINQDNATNEGIKSNIVGGILTLMTLLPNTSLAKSYEKTITKSVKTEADMDRLIRKGWELNTTDIDTIFNKVKSLKPDTIVHKLSVKLDKELFFESGSFVLNADQTDLIDITLSNLLEDDAIVLNAHVVSSTDKQNISDKLKQTLISKGVSGDNEGLSTLRAKSLTNYIVSKGGINEDIVIPHILHDMGNAEISDKDRYVYVEFQYLKMEEIEVDEIVSSVTKTYNMTKTFMHKPRKQSKNKRIGNGLIGKVNSYKSRGAIKCSIFKKKIF